MKDFDGKIIVITKFSDFYSILPKLGVESDFHRHLNIVKRVEERLNYFDKTSKTGKIISEEDLETRAEDSDIPF